MYGEDEIKSTLYLFIIIYRHIQTAMSDFQREAR